MKGRNLRRRTRERGYTLIELMVVVILIALIAMLAAPSLVRARSDRLAFNYARTIAEVVHGAHSRAAGRGAAHLVTWSKDVGPRGAVYVFEGLDGTGPASTPAGPNPSSSCRGPAQWVYASTFVPGVAVDGTNRAAFVDGVNLNVTGGSAEVVVQENIAAIGHLPDPSGIVGAELDAFVLCVTPNGTTYFGQGSNVASAITAMQGSTPYAGSVEIDVSRRDGADAVVGLNRRIIFTGGAAPRIKSE